MPAPIVLAHIAKRCGHTTLRRYSMTARRENLGKAGRFETLFSQTERGPQPGTTSAYDNDVIGMINNWICLAHDALTSKRYF